MTPCKRCADLEAKYHELVKELLAMKREGFVASQALPPPQALPELDPDIRTALREVSEVGSPVYRRLQREAWDRLAAGEDPAVVAALLRKGEEVSL